MSKSKLVPSAQVLTWERSQRVTVSKCQCCGTWPQSTIWPQCSVERVDSLKWKRMCCFLLFTRVWKILHLPRLRENVGDINVRCVDFTQSPLSYSYSYCVTWQWCRTSAASTGAGLEVALCEDGGDGGGVVQAVVVVWAQGRGVQGWALSRLSLPPVRHHHHHQHHYHHHSHCSCTCYIKQVLCHSLI